MSRKKVKELQGLREQVISEAGGLCKLLGPNCTMFATMGAHWVPLSKGGRSEKENLRPACEHCAVDKQNMLPSEWVVFASKKREKS